MVTTGYRCCSEFFRMQTPRRPAVLWKAFWLLQFATAATIAPSSTSAQEPPAADAPPQLVTLVRIHLPLTGSADQTLQATMRRIRDQLLSQARVLKTPQRPTLVLQLETSAGDDTTDGNSQFERALAVAQFLCRREMAGVRTVAFVPHSLEGHGVLLALACEEIVMSPDATIGRANSQEPSDSPIRQTVVSAYREIAETQRTIPVALALGMIDPEKEVHQIESETGTHFLLQTELEKFTSQHEVISDKILVPAGTVAQFDGREGRKFGFVKYLAANRQGLATALGVDEEALVEDQSLAEEWRPVIIEVKGEITPQTASRFDTLLGSAVEQHGANWICVDIDSSGGDLASALRIASSLARLDANSVRTIAYVPQEAQGGAAVIALSCDQLALQPDARLAAVSTAGNKRQPGQPMRQPRAKQDNAALSAGIHTIRDSLAPRTDRTWSLLAAMIDSSIELAEYQNGKTGEMKIMSPAEMAELDNSKDWQRRGNINADHQRLELTGADALERGIAWRTVDSFDELKQQYGVRGEVPKLKPNPALEFIEALATPELAIILLMVGFAGIYIELRTPGVGAGAFVGAVALMLFFWSKYLNGTAGWLEVLLFLAGFCFVLLEVLVLPGFGVFGLGGGAMMLASLVLASLTFVTPHSEAEMDQLARSVGTVALAGLGMMAFVLVSRRYLPQTPLLRNMVLAPPEAEEQENLGHREAIVDYSNLIGQQGVATTDLRPAGKARFDHTLIDVIAEAEPLEQGTRLIVVEARGSRVVVRANQA